jgi:hypothetical protein
MALPFERETAAPQGRSPTSCSVIRIGGVAVTAQTQSVEPVDTAHSNRPCLSAITIRRVKRQLDFRRYS